MHLFKKKLYLTPIRAKLNKVEDKQLFVRDEWNDSLMTAPEFQQLSAYSISRSWKTYQLRHIQVERRNHKAERMWFYVCLLRILDVNERNDKCQWCQRTSPYPINIESITYRGLDEVNVIRLITYTCTMVLFAICPKSNTDFESVCCVRENAPQARLPSASWLT